MAEKYRPKAARIARSINQCRILENQQLVPNQPEPVKNKGGRKLGSRNHTPRLGRHALDQARKEANKWLAKNGIEGRIDDNWSVLSQMIKSAMIEDARQNALPIEEQNRTVYFAMLKEISPYVERKAPAQTVEEVKKADSPEETTDSMESWVYEQLRKKNADARVAELAAADAERHNYKEDE